MCCAGCQGDERRRSHAVEVVSQHQDQTQSDTLRQQQQQQQQPVPAVHPIGSPQANTPRDNRPVRRSQPEANPEQQTPLSKSDDAIGSEDQSQQEHQGDNETDSFTPGAGGQWAGRTRGSAVKEPGVGQQVPADDVQPLHVQEPESQLPPSQTAAAQGNGRHQLAAATPEAQATGQGHDRQRTARGKRKNRRRAKGKGKGASHGKGAICDTKAQDSVPASRAADGEGLSGAKRKSPDQQDQAAVEAGNGQHAKCKKGSDEQAGQVKGTTQQQPVQGNTARNPVRGRLFKLRTGHASAHTIEQALSGREQLHGQGCGDGCHQQVQAAANAEQGGLAGPRSLEQHSASMLLKTGSRSVMWKCPFGAISRCLCVVVKLSKSIIITAYKCGRGCYCAIPDHTLRVK